MKTTCAYLDQAKENAGIVSDYALAKHLGVSDSAVANWRKGRSSIAPNLAPKLAELAGEDEAAVLLTAQIERAATPGERAVWERLLKRIGNGAMCYVISAAAVTATAITPSTAKAEAGFYDEWIALRVTDYAKSRRRSGRRRPGFRPPPCRIAKICKVWSESEIARCSGPFFSPASAA